MAAISAGDAETPRAPGALRSIRGALLAAIVLGVVVPALSMLVFDTLAARRFDLPLVERNRAAVVRGALLGLAGVHDEAAQRRVLAGVLEQPGVCGVELRAHGVPLALERCAAAEPRAWREARLGGGERLRVAFGEAEVEALLDARRQVVVQLVVAQIVLGVAVLAAVLYFRLLRPIARLKAQAGAIARHAPAVAPERAPRLDELGELGAHLDAMRLRIDGLIAELERKNAQLRKMAMYDHLTGLPNRTLFHELFQHEAAVARRHGRRMALLFIDLDRFKTVNDSLGHAVGDELLLATSQRLLQALRESEAACRHSGDEFLVLLRDAERWEQVAAAAERLLRAVEAPLPLHRGDAGPADVQVSASVGIALFPRDGESFEALLRHADMAMYQSKQEGRARYSFYHDDLDRRLVDRVGVERELAQAIVRGELVLHYQPIVAADDSGALRGLEALVRWQHPLRGLLGPATFIGVAEEAGLVGELGAWTLDEVCAQLARWRAAGFDPGRVAVNVSALQFRDRRLVETIERSLLRHGVAASALEIELTESTLMSDDETTQRVVAALRALGLALVVDDFGTGYSSLSYLKRLRPDKLKIDRAFVRDLPDNADDRALTQAVLSMARALDIAVVAEGVENDAQRRFLAERGCALLQGFLLGRPAPGAEVGAAWGRAAVSA